MPTLFISYRHSDSEQVDRLVAALEQEGVTCWLDRNDIEDAASIQKRIDEGLAKAHALLAWYSLDYPKSRACQWELTAAMIAAGTEAEPNKRLLIINPESGTGHIQPVQARDLEHFPFPVQEQKDYPDLARRIKAALAGIHGTLGALRRLQKPRWYGAHGLGSNRFVGRVPDLWRIHSALAMGNHAIVAGLPAPKAAGELARIRGSGGIGKSLLSEEYALRFGAWSPGGIFWLRAYGNSDNPDETAAELAVRREAAYGSQLAGFARELGLDIRDRTDAEIRADLGRHLHDRQQPYLWVVDDLPEVNRQELERWLAPSSNGQTLLSTRSRKLQGLGVEIDLTTLPPEDARALLTRDRPPTPDEESDVTLILVLLDGHSLALDVARTACRRLGYPAFHRQLQHPDRDALDLAAELAGELPNGHNPHIALTLLSSVRQLGQTGLDCLRLAARLASAPIPLSLLTDCLANADRMETMDAETQSALGLQQILNESLAEETEDWGAYAVHTLVSRTLRAYDPNPERQQQLYRATLAVLSNKMQAAADISQHLSLQPLLPHVQLLAEDSTDKSSLDLAGWLGCLESEAGRYRTARDWYRQEYQGKLSLLGEEHPRTLTSMNNLADTLLQLGDLKGARALEEQVLEAFRCTLREDHPQTLSTMNNLAEILRGQGDLDGARALQEQVLEARRRTLGEEHPDTLTSMNNLAGTLSQRGDLNGARDLEEQVLETRRRILGEEHPDTHTSMGNLASTLRGHGDLNGARALEKQVLEARRRTLGEEHPNTLTSMNNLAETLRDQGDLKSTRALQEQALEARRRTLGEEHPATLTSMNNLALILQSQGDLNGARDLQEQVLEARRRTLGEEHPATLRSMNNLALTLQSQGDLNGARKLQEQVLDAFRRTIGEEHPDSLTSMNNLAHTLWHVGQQSEALALMQEAAAGIERALGSKHPKSRAFTQAARQMQVEIAQIKKS